MLLGIDLGGIVLNRFGLRKQRRKGTIVEIEEGSFQATNVRVTYNVEKVIKQFSESDYPNCEVLASILTNVKL